MLLEWISRIKQSQFFLIYHVLELQYQPILQSAWLSSELLLQNTLYFIWFTFFYFGVIEVIQVIGWDMLAHFFFFKCYSINLGFIKTKYSWVFCINLCPTFLQKMTEASLFIDRSKPVDIPWMNCDYIAIESGLLPIFFTKGMHRGWVELFMGGHFCWIFLDFFSKPLRIIFAFLSKESIESPQRKEHRPRSKKKHFIKLLTLVLEGGTGVPIFSYSSNS